MEEFSLIQRLNEKDDKKPSPLAEGISYQQYEIEVEGKVRNISIPLREAENFEDAVTEYEQPLTRKALKLILREFRGIRGE